MFLIVNLTWNIIIPPESLDFGLRLQRTIFIKLLTEFARSHAHKDLGYHIAVTTVENIGTGIVRHTGEVVFPVEFKAMTFRVFRGEVLGGVVYSVMKHGVLLRCGPIENVFISSEEMTAYSYVPGVEDDQAEFVSANLGKVIRKDVEVRFMVMRTRWLEVEKELEAEATLEGDYLGPMC
ncbi:DNA-directed RNA polymerase V subunit 7 [Linum grandiflorum]